MTIDIEELKRLAEPLAAPNGADSNASWWDSFHRAANPAAILELITEIERLRDDVSSMTGEADALERQLNEARNNDITAMGYLADCRIASGDNGKRMLPEFVEYLREMKRQRDEVNGMTGTLARLREQKPVRWYVRGNYFHDGDAAILFASMNAVHGAKVEQLYAAPVSAPHKGATHCDDCGLTWLDDGLNPLGCPYCKQAPDSDTVRDAERYRWLRSDASAYQAQTILNDQPDAIDAAIDAARGAK